MECIYGAPCYYSALHQMTCLAMLDQSTFVSLLLFFLWSVTVCWLFWGHSSIFLFITVVACLLTSVGSFPLPIDLFSPCILSFHLKSCQKSGRYGSFHTDVCALLQNRLAVAPRGFSHGFAHETWTVLLSENADCSTLYMHFPPVYCEGVLCELFSVLHW